MLVIIKKNKDIVLCIRVLLTNFVVINILINNLKKQTMSAIEIITNELQTLGRADKAAHLSRFFKHAVWLWRMPV